MHRVAPCWPSCQEGLEIWRSQGRLNTVLLVAQTTNQVWPRGMQAHELLSTGTHQTPEKRSCHHLWPSWGRLGVGTRKDLQSPWTSSLRLWYGFCPLSASRVRRIAPMLTLRIFRMSCISSFFFSACIEMGQERVSLVGLQLITEKNTPALNVKESLYSSLPSAGITGHCHHTQLGFW